MMRDKYVEERFSQYMIFGGVNGLVDVVERGTAREVVSEISVDEANAIISARADIVNAMILLAQKFDKAAPEFFTAAWYTDPDAISRRK